MAAFDYTRPAVSCAAVGVARAAMEYAIQYAKERKTFNVPLYVLNASLIPQGRAIEIRYS